MALSVDRTTYSNCSGDQVRKNKSSLSCSTYGDDENYTQGFSEETARKESRWKVKVKVKVKGKGKVRPRTGLEGPEGEQMYSSTVPYGRSTPRPGRFTAGKDTVPTVQEAG